jgi:hypothetical protein
MTKPPKDWDGTPITDPRRLKLVEASTRASRLAKAGVCMLPLGGAVSPEVAAKARTAYHHILNTAGGVVLLFAMLLLSIAGAAGAATPPLGCYTLHEVLGPPSAGWPDQVFPWYLCPAESWRDLGGSSPLTPVLAELQKSGPAESTWWATMASGLSGYSLGKSLCRAVFYVRSVSPRDPRDGRDRSGQEIKRWLLDTVGGPDRPPEVRSLVGVVAQWSPSTLKTWHDALKIAWPEVQAAACPEERP